MIFTLKNNKINIKFLKKILININQNLNISLKMTKDSNKIKIFLYKKNL